MLLSGRIALVTGGGRGIGRACSQVLSREGAKVAVADLSEESVAETVKSLDGDGHLSIVMDVASTESVSNAKEKVSSVCLYLHRVC